MYLYTFEQRREPSEHGIGAEPSVDLLASHWFSL